MEKEGLIERRPGPHDRRSVIVRATDHGIAAFHDAIAAENRVEHELLKTLSDEERAILGTLLRKLLLAIDPVDVP